jgi:dipeptidyl aminopeptidase/acylaminoacyl peptidase
MKTSRLLILAGLLSAAPLAAQQAAQRPLTVADFDQWRSVQGETLSPDGRWAAYSLVPQVGEGEVVVRALPSGPEYRHTRGYIGRPETRPGAKRGSGYRAPPAEITADSRWVVFTLAPPREALERAHRQKEKGSEPKGSLGIMSLADGKVTTVPGVKSFKLPEKSGRWVAYLLEKDGTPAAQPDSAAPGAAAAAPGGEARPISADTAGKEKKETGATLVLRELATGADVRIAGVTGYTFDERGAWLGYTVSSRDGARDGAYVRSLADGRTHVLLTGEGSYRGLVFDRAGMQAAFVSDRDARGKEKRHALYHASLRSPAARRAVASAELPGGWIISAKDTLRFSEDGRLLRFGAAPPPLDSVPADSLADKAVLDLWHWRDPRLQPQQHVEASKDRERAYAAVYQPGTGRFRVLGNDTLREIRFSENGRVGVANATLPYAVSAMWGEGGNDVYVVDAVSGVRRLVKRNVPFAASVSPGGRYALFFDRDRRWHAYEVASGRTRDLTGALGVRFDQETWDTPSDPAPWGVAGWTEGDRSVLLYDRYDVWEIDPAGRRPARVVTDSVGRRGKLIFRVADLDPEEEWIDPADPLLLRAVDDETKATGFWRDRLGAAAPPARLVMENRQLGLPTKAKEAEVYLFTRSTVREFPDLWVSGPDFSTVARASEANPQQARYRWATVELVRWRSADGVELKGLLYRPEGFDPSRKYPMVVYFYEQLSDELHRYRMDVPRNTIQPTLYASQGYLVFIPDIHYTDGYPGESALKSIVPGVQALVARGFVDPDGVGIQGQSWGGYQTAYIITRTPMFRAAMAGAPVANMTSAYGGIRWESGLARAFQYEVGQSRIGGSLWEHPWRYIENSPLFAADRVTTPLLIMHNDADGAVPWQQGIEMFVALRRLGKETYLINYNGDAHNPTKRANQLDVAARMLQFFDHHLKGEPAPEWMRRGIPFLQKGREQVTAQPAEVPVTTAPAPAGEKRP